MSHRCPQRWINDRPDCRAMNKHATRPCDRAERLWITGIARETISVPRQGYQSGGLQPPAGVIIVTQVRRLALEQVICPCPGTGVARKMSCCAGGRTEFRVISL
jgi:hypothetical protein